MLEGDNADFQWGRDEALANEGLGDVAFDQDRFREAYEYYQAYLKSIARVLQKAPSNARIRREVAVAYQRVGEVALRLEKRDEARTEFQMCSETAEHASTAFEPRNPEPQNTGEYCRAKLAAIAPIAAVHRVPTP
jgi:tetratricopeptide (TPR) repeat protein